MPDLAIGAYERLPARFERWDPRTVDVAARVRALVERVVPDVVVEHVGSTAVPGLPGKGVVDLALEAAPAEIPPVVEALLRLGFVRQGGAAPFPPTRPMLIGSLDHDDSRFRLHVHVMPPARRELAELTGFRDALRADARLRDAYAATKRAIVDRGSGAVSNSQYTADKAEFVEESLLDLGIRGRPADRVEPLAPGSTVGVMGGGQLGRMLGFAARAMGYGLVALDPDPACPTAAVADDVIEGAYDDSLAALRLAAASDVVTYELEHVGFGAAGAAAGVVPLRPGLDALRVTQDRLAERRFIRDVGEWATPWRAVRGPAEAVAAAEELGYPLRLKVPLGGYDGRGQVRIASAGEVAVAVERLRGTDGRPLLLEREVDFAAELSVVTARDRDGRVCSFPVARNRHEDGILVETVAPAPIDPHVAFVAQSTGAALARAMDLVGVLTVELFQLRDGRGLMVNELAPRVHNSGHWTIEGAATSQFEQHLRAILGLPLGSVAPHATAAMVNTLGTGADRPARLAGVEGALRDPGVHVHVYGKRRVFAGRKMGHVTVVADDVEEALDRARRARAALRWED